MQKVSIRDLDNIYQDIKPNIKNKRRIYDFERYKLEYLQIINVIIKTDKNVKVKS